MLDFYINGQYADRIQTQSFPISQFSEKDLPGHLRWQILSFLRIQWPDDFSGENQFRDWIGRNEFHPTHIVMTHGNILISHVAVVSKQLTHIGQTYKTYGLSGMFTYPSLRGKGRGLNVVKTAIDYIGKQDGDIVLITSILAGYYEKAGIEYLPSAKVFSGNPDHQKDACERVYMQFLSEKGKAGRKDFETHPIFFGPQVW